MDAKKKTFIEAMKASLGNITKACEAIGINRTTYYRWLEDEEFKSEVENIDEYVIDFAEHSLFKQIQENNTTATIFYLKTKGKHRGYVERQELDQKIDANVKDTPTEVVWNFIDAKKKGKAK